MIYKASDGQIAAPLFANWEETLIWSCVQGVMGSIYTNAPVHPTAAMAVLGDFTFFAGEADLALVSYKPASCANNFMIMVPQNQAWLQLSTAYYSDRAKIVSRYATKKDPSVFDAAKLQKAAASLSGEYELRTIDEPLFHMCRSSAWSADLVSQFSDYEHYRNMGLGVVICRQNNIVSGASSYARYRDGIEIEIDTRHDCRRRGLAYVCGARLILECLERGCYPSWDAQNKASLALAQKLGSHYSHTYTAVEIQGY